jgi:hypothetical protein
MRAEPTYATPRSPDRHSDGPTVGLAIARWLGRRPTPWQQAALDVALERFDGPGSPFAYDTIVEIVGRRCGKTVNAFGVPLARGLAGPVHLPNGRRLPFKATHTAQNLTSARIRFQKDLVEPYERHFTALEWARGADFKRAAADTVLLFDPRRGKARKNLAQAVRLQRASEIRVLAPTPNNARGDGVMHITWDEALTYTLERGQDLNEAARPTLAEMHGYAQSWTVSNISLGTDERMHLWHLRQRGRAAVAAGRREGLCYLEFSLPPGADPLDERAWWRYYPALGDGIVGIAQLRRDLEEFGVDAFAAEYLGRWPDENDTGVPGWDTIILADWLDARTEDEAPPDGAAAIGVDLDPYGRDASIVAATARADGVDGSLWEVLENRPGSGWVLESVRRLAPDVEAIGVDDYGPGHDLLEQLAADPLVAAKLVPTKATDFSAACFATDADLREHRQQWRASEYHEALTRSAAAAQRTPGKAWQWERRVAVPQSALVAATLASWARAHTPAPASFFVY